MVIIYSFNRYLDAPVSHGALNLKSDENSEKLTYKNNNLSYLPVVNKYNRSDLKTNNKQNIKSQIQGFGQRNFAGLSLSPRGQSDPGSFIQRYFLTYKQ